MPTHDYVIANASGSAVRSDINNALAAIVSNNSNGTSPATTYAYQWWADTTTGQLKLRNSDNDGWITIFELDGTMLMEDGTVSAPGLAFASDLNTGFFRSAADKINFATGGAERLEIGSSEVVFNDPSNDVDFRVESNGNTHMLFVDAGNDAIGIGTSGPADYSSSADDLVIAGSGQRGITIASTDSNQSNIFFADATSGSGEFAGYLAYIHSSDALAFGANGAEAARIDSSGRLLIGTSSARTHFYNTLTYGSQLLIEQAGSAEADYAQAAFVRNSNNANGSELIIGKTRGTTVNSLTLIQAADTLGRLRFQGADGTNMVDGAEIAAFVDSTPGANDMPSCLTFSTTADGASTTTERVRIDSAGNLGVGLTSLPAAGFNKAIRIKSATGAAGVLAEAADASSWLGLYGGTSTSDSAALLYPNTGSLRIGTTSVVGTTSFSEKLRVDSSGHMMIGTTTKGNGAADDLTVASSGNTGITIRSSSSTSAAIYFADGTSGTEGYQGIVQYYHGTDQLQFYTNYAGSSNARMIIDSSGRLLVGTSTEGETTADNLTVADSANCGITIRSGTSNQGALFFSDATSGTGEYDGFITYDQGTRSMRLGTAAGERIRILSSGGITFNGDTSTDNALDDYEEGTWTPVYSSGITSPGYNIQSANYTKIGDLVTFTLNLRASSGTNAGSHLILGGLPFTSSSSKEAGGAFFNYRDDLTTNVAPFLHIQKNTSGIQFYTNTGSAWNGTDGNGIINRNLSIQGYYYV
jgi:hypothetical protein|tara:strand:- start:67 stop:2331 length:2265 start_codon:yes stop_codon:yes gene_type:complete